MKVRKTKPSLAILLHVLECRRKLVVFKQCLAMRLHQRKASLEQAKVSVHSLKCKPAYEAPASASSGSLQKARAYLLARSGSSPSCFRTLTIPGSQKRIAYKPVQLQPQQTCPSYLSLSLSLASQQHLARSLLELGWFHQRYLCQPSVRTS